MSVIISNEVVMSEGFTSEECGLLNMECTPAIEAVLIAYVYEQARQEIADFTANRNDWVQVDNDDVAYLVELQLFISRCDTRIEECESRLEAFKTNRVSKDVWSSWNNGKWSFINSKRATLAIIKEFTARKGEAYRKALWASFFKIEDTEEFFNAYVSSARENFSPYWTNGDTEQVDSQSDLFISTIQYIDNIMDAHIAEANQPRALGAGYWKYAEYIKVKNKGLTKSIKLNRAGLMFAI